MAVRIWRTAQAARQSLLDLLFPPRCVICRRADADWFCTVCRSKIDKILPPLCDRCGRPLHTSVCPYCQKLPIQIDGIRAMAFFEGNLRRAIHVFKYNDRPELARVLGKMLSDHLSAHPLPVDAITVVPLHKSRQDARGYNQAFLIALALSVQHNLPCWEDALTRVRATKSQVELDAAARHANVQDAFVADGRVAGARLLLIDDVCTTGATLDACSVALRQRGAESVWGLALARGR